MPSAAELRAALAALFPDQSRLEQAIHHFSEVSQADGHRSSTVSIWTFSGKIAADFRK
jgi:hypothetical protein